MCTYVGESSFGKLTKVTEQTKAMIDSWSVSDNNTANKKLEFNPVVPNMHQNMDMNQHRQSVSKDDYIKYGWLFGTK